jgi:sterol desaturase/sphingolipid hydroxylase (fatty acid hydroxylase superfamily)
MFGQDIPDLITPAIPAFILAMLVEGFVLARARKTGDGPPLLGYVRADTTASISMGLGYAAVSLFWKVVAYGAYLALYTWSPLKMGSGPLAWVALFFLDDLAYYWFHRMHHECRVLWASHVVHHSSEHYNLSTALRQPWTPMSASLFWLPLALLGFHPAMIVTMQALNLLYQFWIHTETVRSIGPLEAVLNSPSHHRVHHASNPRYLDRNYAGILIVWDRLFGTFVPEDATDPPKYGLTKNIRTFNPVRIAFHEFADIVRDVRKPNPWRVRLGYVFRGPGWKPALPPPAGPSPAGPSPALPSPAAGGPGVAGLQVANAAVEPPVETRG